MVTTGSVSLVSDESTPDPANDEAYRSLFREPEPTPIAESAPEPAPMVDPEPEYVADVAAEQIVVVEPVAEPVVVAAAPSTDTGRLFRSAHFQSPTEAIPAVSRDRANHLRTLQVSAVAAGPAPDPIRIGSQLPLADPPVEDSNDVTPRRTRRPSTAGLNALGVTIVVGGATLIAGLLDIFIGGAGLGVLTGIVLVASSAFAATRVRPETAPVAVITPPLAFFVAAITVGQLGQSNTAGGLGIAVTLFFMLAENWIWIIGATVVALAIVLVRGRQSR